MKWPFSLSSRPSPPAPRACANASPTWTTASARRTSPSARDGKSTRPCPTRSTASRGAGATSTPPRSASARRCAARCRSARTNCPSPASSSRCVSDERDWEGAAERLLHGFGLALLVPDAHYKAVADWVDRQHLGARLVYFHVRQKKAAQGASLHPQSLVRKLVIKPDSPHYDWLEQELRQRFDVACCDTGEQFRREARAITRAGQIKDPSGATRRTTAAASTTAAATCSAGAMPTSCAPCGTSATGWRRSWPCGAAHRRDPAKHARNWRVGWRRSPGWRSSRASRISTG